MTDKTTASQVHNTLPGAEAWKKTMEEQVARVGEVFAEVTKLQGQFMSFQQQQADELNKLMKQSMQYATSLSEEMRKFTLHSSKAMFGGN